jgi:hypothetical protein
MMSAAMRLSSLLLASALYLAQGDAGPAIDATWATSIASDRSSNVTSRGVPCDGDTWCQNDSPGNLVVHPSGDTYVVGSFRGVMHMAGLDLASRGQGKSMYVAILSPTGAPLHAVAFHAEQAGMVVGDLSSFWGSWGGVGVIAVNPHGDIVVAAGFSGRVRVGSTVLETDYAYHEPHHSLGILLVVLDASTLAVKQTTVLGNGNPHYAPMGLEVGPSGDIAIMGSYRNSTGFGVPALELGYPDGSNTYTDNYYVAVLDGASLVVKHTLFVGTSHASYDGLQDLRSFAFDGTSVALSGTLLVQDWQGGGDTRTILGAAVKVKPIVPTPFVVVLDASLSPSSAAAISCLPGFLDKGALSGASVEFRPSGHLAWAINGLSTECSIFSPISQGGGEGEPHMLQAFPQVAGSRRLAEDDGVGTASALVLLSPTLQVEQSAVLAKADKYWPQPEVSSLAVDPVSSNVIVAGTYAQTSSFGLHNLNFTAADSSRSWEPQGFVAAVDPSTGAVQYVVKLAPAAGCSNCNVDIRDVEATTSGITLAATYKGDSILFGGSVTPDRQLLSASSGTFVSSYDYSYSYGGYGYESASVDPPENAEGSLIVRLAFPSSSPSPSAANARVVIQPGGTIEIAAGNTLTIGALGLA